MGKKWRDVRVGDVLVTGKKKGRISYYPITQEEKEIGEKQGKKLSTDGRKKREEKEEVPRNAMHALRHKLRCQAGKISERVLSSLRLPKYQILPATCTPCLTSFLPSYVSPSPTPDPRRITLQRKVFIKNNPTNLPSTPPPP